MDKCFVIQPFDKGKYDDRYDSTFVPAIEEANLEAYRVDRDPAISIPINEIQSKIKKSKVCFAEITTDNPNVWFELGYAIASGKEVVLVCSAERTKFPFDIQHRSIIKYTTESKKDFETLQKQITKKLKAILKKEQTLDRVGDMSTIAKTEGLAANEMVALVTIAENIDGLDDNVSACTIKDDMERAGFNKIAWTLAYRILLKKGMITYTVKKDCDGYDNDLYLYSICDKGMAWLENNKDKLVLKKQKSEPEIPSYSSSDNDIPF